MAIHGTQIWSMLVLLVLGSNLGLGHQGHHSGSCASAVHEAPAHHHCDHRHDHHHRQEKITDLKKLPEELAEEEDLILYGFGSHQGHDHGHEHHNEHGASELSGAGLWIHAMGCSLLVSMASLICLIILPVIFIQGNPSKAIVDSLAVFGAGAMLGDAFLHQLPHAFGGEHSNSHDHVVDHAHSHVHFGLEHFHSNSHSLQDLSVGLSVLAGIVLFLLVEKTVRYVEDNSGGANEWGHSRHHHHRKNSKRLKHDSDDNDKIEQQSDNKKSGSISKMSSEEKVLDEGSDDCLIGEKQSQSEPLLQKHNFTDGMALGSAFLLYGSVGGWSRTLFLLAHELPQEIGDFGILVRSGFSVSKALFFNFLSALVALSGTALALMLGQDPGQSSLIEGFTAGGFMYIAVAGVLAEMNNGSSSIKSTAIQLTSLILGMSVALCISLFE
ncbi:IAA-alanine resistance protein 1-like isoform X2 [Actinidia eriantha]|uniref:IAA-alanine resistance protein 1-like isoform X2 n=1 Tax=Actinidia eriantha TaxID=165200 RepID=UPI00258A0412|nr:IAA-alanine resistance protein 1-like isoform X2 [Actinidia eriantha]